MLNGSKFDSGHHTLPTPPRSTTGTRRSIPVCDLLKASPTNPVVVFEQRIIDSIYNFLSWPMLLYCSLRKIWYTLRRKILPESVPKRGLYRVCVERKWSGVEGCRRNRELASRRFVWGEWCRESSTRSLAEGTATYIANGGDSRKMSNRMKLTSSGKLCVMSSLGAPLRVELQRYGSPPYGSKASRFFSSIEL